MICRTCFRRASALGRQVILPKAAPVRSNRHFATTAAPGQAAAATDATDATDKAGGEPAAGARSICVEGTVLAGLNIFKDKTDPVALRDDEYPEWLWSCLDVQKKADTAEDEGAGDEWCMPPPPKNPNPSYILPNTSTTENTLTLTCHHNTAKSKKQRRLAAKRQRALEAKLLASGDISALAPKVPLQQQTINLPVSPNSTPQEAFVAAEKREELRKAMRKERKAKIKEANYLKSM